MKTTDFTTSITVASPATEVFKAINNVTAWWQGEIKGSSKKVGDEFEYRMPGIHYSKQKVTEMVANEKIVWLVTDSSLDFLDDKTEWNGTKIIFEIAAVGNSTELRFTHAGLVPTVECYDSCTNGWTQLLKKSLYSLITTGKGKDVF